MSSSWALLRGAALLLSCASSLALQQVKAGPDLAATSDTPFQRHCFTESQVIAEWIEAQEPSPAHSSARLAWEVPPSAPPAPDVTKHSTFDCGERGEFRVRWWHKGVVKRVRGPQPADPWAGFDI